MQKLANVILQKTNFRIPPIKKNYSSLLCNEKQVFSLVKDQSSQLAFFVKNKQTNKQIIGIMNREIEKIIKLRCPTITPQYKLVHCKQKKGWNHISHFQEYVYSTYLSVIL